MCGIAGIISPINCQETFDSLKVIEALSHRGPDGSGLMQLNQESGKVLFVHTRLSIIDNSNAGSQPMQIKSGLCNKKIAITFNGEIYNFRELRNELIVLGHQFKSNSDTEVILQGYQEWGTSFFQRLRGMFAFALADQNRDRVYLVRDHFGIKPIYMNRNCNGALVFASEVKAFDYLTNRIPGHRKIRIDALHGFLSLGMILGNQSYVEGIEELQPGFILELDFAGKTIRTESINKEIISNFDSCLDRKQSIILIKEFFCRSIERHLVSDVPIGVFLSSGIDSSALATIASVNHPNLQTITIGFDQKEIDETNEAKRIANYLGLKNEVISLTGNMILSSLENVFEVIDQPTIDGFNTFFVSKATRSFGLKVALSGLGGDELFGGYSSFRDLPRARVLQKISKILGFGKIISKFGKQFGSRAIWKAGRTGESADGMIGLYFLRRELFSPEDRIDLLGPPSKEIEPTTGITLELYENFVNQISKLDLENSVGYLEQQIYMRNMLLRDSDVFSMANGLEIRVPFLDQDLVQLVNPMPGKWKRPGRQLKSLLVEGLGEMFPKWILRRKKRGFTFPWNAWLRGPMRQFAQERLSSEVWKNIGVRKSNVDSIWKRFDNGDPSISAQQILALVVLGDQIVRKNWAL